MIVKPSSKPNVDTSLISPKETLGFGRKFGDVIVVLLGCDITTLPISAMSYLVTDGNTTAVPSTTRVTELSTELRIVKSYTYRPGERSAVFAAVIVRVI